MKTIDKRVFEKIPAEKIKEISQSIMLIKDKIIENYTEDIVRFLVDIEEEIVTISFYSHMDKEGE